MAVVGKAQLLPSLSHAHPVGGGCATTMKGQAMKILYAELIKPMAHRLGSALGLYLGGLELMTQAEADTVGSAVTILAGYAVDLVVRKVL